MGFLDGLFDTEGFPPRWQCGTGWTDLLGWTHVVSDVLIFLAYLAIPAAIWFFLRRREDLPFPRLGWCLIAFIFSCGIVHLLEAIIFWEPLYRLSAVLKVVTALVSLFTAFAFARAMPRLLDIPGQAALSRELKRTNIELARSNRDLEAFAYMASHDLSSPLGAIDGYLDLVIENSGPRIEEEDRLFLEQAQSAAERMRGMIDSILAFSRVQRDEIDELTTVDVEGVMTELAELRRSSGQAFDLEVEPLPLIHSSRPHVERVLENLLDNAIKYTDARPRIRVTASRTDDKVVIRFRDHGIGIAPESRDRVFQIFQRLHTQSEFEGTGIGLAMCRRIVEHLGGDIAIADTEGRGTTFAITLPAATS